MGLPQQETMGLILALVLVQCEQFYIVPSPILAPAPGPTSVQYERAITSPSTQNHQLKSAVSHITPLRWMASSPDWGDQVV